MMAMSKDRVLFTLPPRYYQRPPVNHNAMARDVCEGILLDAFGVSRLDARTILESSPEGVRILCRPSQFARFIVLRFERGKCINGVRDLEPMLVGDRPDPVGEISRRTGYSRLTAEEILTTAANVGYVEPRFVAPCWPLDTWDFSRNPSATMARV